jgi:hypothetical protein
MMRIASNGSLPSSANMIPPAIMVSSHRHHGVAAPQKRDGWGVFPAGSLRGLRRGEGAVDMHVMGAAQHQADLLHRQARGGARRDRRPSFSAQKRSETSSNSSRSWLMTTPPRRSAARSSSAWRIAAAALASTPHVGWFTISTSGLLQDLAPDHEFLQVAARQRARGDTRARGAHVEAVDDLLGEGARGPSRRSPTVEPPPRPPGQHRVFRQAHVRRGGMAQPFLRRGEQAKAPRGKGPVAPMGVALELDHPGATAAFARQRGQQFILPVARHPADAQDFARAHLEPDMAQRRAEGGRRAASGPIDGQQDLARRRAPRAGWLSDLPTIISAICARTPRAGVQVATTLPSRRIVAASQSARISSSLWEM